MIPLESAVMAIRFGTGLHPVQPAPSSPDDLLSQVSRRGQADPDVPDFSTRRALIESFSDVRKKTRDGRENAKEMRVEARQPVVKMMMDDQRRMLRRMVLSPEGFHERLVSFWADHFTVAARSVPGSLIAVDMIETAIRPHVGGRFSDMLKAVVKHPAMLQYLNQSRSVGPNSPAGQRRDMGLNENLAREILELHTLGVGGAYTQTDVREFAELLTGYSFNRDGFKFRSRIAEPGAETVLGTRYGGRDADVSDAEAALDDLAVHRDTARHLAQKLVVHFLGTPVSQDLVERLAAVYLKANGKLKPVYRALLSDPQALALPLRKAKTPVDFVVSALRALGPIGERVLEVRDRALAQTVLQPMAAMGQPPLRPPGPDGWPEAPEDWITPQGLAARVSWSGALARNVARGIDPRAFVETALGPIAGPVLTGAVAGAETRAEGVALVLSSPEFNRR